MGVRRLRGGLDQLQKHANVTMFDAQEAIELAKATMADFKDGFGVKLVNKGNLADIVGFLMGRTSELPMFVVIDPQEDAQNSTAQKEG